MNPLLTIRNLHVHFNTSAGRLQAVRGVDLQLNSGEIVGLVGESGCGKSVTAHAILQILNENSQINEGQILFEDCDLVKTSQKEIEKIRGKKIGMIFQDPLSALNPTMRIGQQIIEVLVKHENLSYTEAYEKALAVLIKVGISDPTTRMHQYPHEFSGGMCQRIMIAIAICCEPSLIIADEPTTALDVTIQAQILDLLKTIRKQQTSILLITHDLGVVAHLCDRVLVMYGGKIVESAPVEKLFSNPQHPYTQSLLKSKASLSLADKTLFSIPGYPPLILNTPHSCTFMPRCPYAMKICQQAEPHIEKNDHSTQVACWLSQKRNPS